MPLPRLIGLHCICAVPLSLRPLVGVLTPPPTSPLTKLSPFTDSSLRKSGCCGWWVVWNGRAVKWQQCPYSAETTTSIPVEEIEKVHQLHPFPDRAQLSRPTEGVVRTGPSSLHPRPEMIWIRLCGGQKGCVRRVPANIVRIKIELSSGVKAMCLDTASRWGRQRSGRNPRTFLSLSHVAEWSSMTIIRQTLLVIPSKLSKRHGRSNFVLQYYAVRINKQEWKLFNINFFLK